MQKRLSITLDVRTLNALDLRARCYGYGRATKLLRALCQYMAREQAATGESDDIKETFETLSGWERDPDNNPFLPNIRKRL